MVEGKIVPNYNFEEEDLNKQAPSSFQKLTSSMSKDDFSLKKRTTKGKFDSTDFKRALNFSDDPQIRHITCN
jgi:WD repeat-containing protein 45